MYKILNSGGLGVAGKQNELIELALTHGFSGVEVDMVDLIGRHDALGKQFACQFLQSAKIDMGTFELPVDLGAPDEEYTNSIANLDTIIDLATTLNAKCCYVQIQSSNGNFSFQECFEKHQQRLQELGSKFTESGVKIGLALRATDGEPGDGEFKFIHTPEELLTLVKSVGLPNVGVCLDAWQWAIGGGTVEQLNAAGIGESVTEIRLADVAEPEPEPAVSDEVESTEKESTETASAEPASAEAAPAEAAPAETAPAAKESSEPESSEPAPIDLNRRTALPGDALDSFSVKLSQAIIASGAEIPFSIATDLTTFARGSRDSIVGKLSKQLDQLIAGQHPAELIQAAEQAAAAAEAADGDADTDSDAPVATETKEPAVAATK